MIQGEFKIITDPFAQAAKLKKGVRNKVIRKAINKTCAKVKAVAVEQAPRGKNGFLKKSIKIRVRNYKDRNVWVGIVGPSSSFRRAKGKIKRGKRKGQTIYHAPVRIVHIVHDGSKRSRANPFLKRTLAQTGGRYLDELTQAVNRFVSEELKG